MRDLTRTDGGDLIKAIRKKIDRAIAAAATLTGKRFGLLVASSVVATSAIVASAMTNPEGGLSPLAALLGRSLAAEQAPVEASAPEEEEEFAPEASGGGAPAPSGPTASATPSAASPAPAPSPVTEEPEEPQETSIPTPEAGPVKHLFVISLVSPGYEASFGPSSQMPYLTTKLQPKGELLSGYSLLDDSAVPNGIAAISGQKPDSKTKEDCPEFDACVLPVETETVANELSAGKFTWGAYLEGMADAETGKPASCIYPGAEEPYPPAEGGYTATRNPFVFFHSLLDLGDCTANDKPLTEFQKALTKEKATPNVTYVTPTLCNSGSTVECPTGQAGGPAAADAFLAEWVPKIQASPAYKKDGMLIITFDQLDPVPAVPGAVPSPTPPKTLQVGTLLLSHLLPPGSTDSTEYNPYSLLRSTEDLFGLEYLEAAGGKKVKSFTEALLGGGGD